MTESADGFSQRLLAWFDVHGRHDLPWQHPRTPYRVWVAEVMLQQTQVATVIPYFERFMARFPDLQALATAELDAVLHLWSGLGYYARARALHRAAVELCHGAGGRLPTELDALQALPGIGRSTAAAILAQAHGQRHAILDGNVRRVLCRYHAVEGWPGRREVEARLWQLAEQHTPPVRVSDYTQAIMDLGATVCARTRPQCHRCPLADGCQALGQARTAELPAPRPRRALPTREAVMLVIVNAAGEVLLERRPEHGLWGGLWALPACASAGEASAWCAERLGCAVREVRPWPSFTHTFSHYHLDIQPVLCRLAGTADVIMEGGRWLWYKGRLRPEVGLAAPIRRLIDRALGETATEDSE